MMREKGERHMVMPTHPGPGLVMVHPQFTLGLFNRRLHRPAQARQAHQLGLRGRPRGVAQKVLDLTRVAPTPAKDNPDLMAGATPTFARRAHESKISRDRPFGTFLDRPALPILRRQVGLHLSQLLSGSLTSGDTRGGARSSRLEITRLALAGQQNLRR